MPSTTRRIPLGGMYIEERKPWKAIWTIAGIAACALLVLIELKWPQLYDARVAVDFPFAGAQSDTTFRMNPLLELLKLVAAAISGALITWVHSRGRREKPISRSVQHAQILLCVSASLMMIIIGGSLARALGIVGGAGVIRFRTLVDDPKDAVVFFDPSWDRHGVRFRRLRSRGPRHRVHRTVPGYG